MLSIKTRKSRIRDYTLVEVMIVVMLLGIMVTFALPAVADFEEQADQAAFTSDVLTYARAANLYRLEDSGSGYFPDGFENYGIPCNEPMVHRLVGFGISNRIRLRQRRLLACIFTNWLLMEQLKVILICCPSISKLMMAIWLPSVSGKSTVIATALS